MNSSGKETLPDGAIIDEISYSLELKSGSYSSVRNWIVCLYDPSRVIGGTDDYYQMSHYHETVDGTLDMNGDASSLFKRSGFELCGEAGSDHNTTVRLGNITITVEYHIKVDYPSPTVSLENDTIYPGQESRILISGQDKEILDLMQHNVRWTFEPNKYGEEYTYLRKSSVGAKYVRSEDHLEDWWNLIEENSISGKIEVKVTTRVSNEKIGKTQKLYQTIMRAPSEEMKPSQKENASTDTAFSYSLLHKEPIHDNRLSSLFIQGISELHFSCDLESFEGKYGANITSFCVAEYSTDGSKLNEKSSSGEPVVLTPTLTEEGTIYKCWVTDSRGLCSEPVQITPTPIKTITYTKPTIEITAEQCTEDGNISTDGTFLRANYFYDISGVSPEITSIVGDPEIVLLYQVAGDGDHWANIKDTNMESGQTVIFGGGNIDATKSYNVKLLISDGVSIVEKKVKATMASFIMFCRDDGTGVGFGTVCKNPKTFVINEDWDFYLGEMNASELLQQVANGEIGGDDEEDKPCDVHSVNGQTGTVILGPDDVGALPSEGTAVDSNKLGGVTADQYALKTDIRAYASSASLNVEFALYTEFDFLTGRWSLTGKLGDTGYHSQMLPIKEHTDYYMGYLNTGVQCVGGFFDSEGKWLSELRTETVETCTYKSPNGDPSKTEYTYVELFKFTAPAGAYFFSYNISDGNAYKYRQYICTKPLFALSNTGNHIIYEGDPLYQEKKDKNLCVIGASGVMIDRMLSDDLNQYIVGFQEYLAPYYNNVESYGFYSGSWGVDTTDSDISIFSGIVTNEVDLSRYDEFILVPSTANLVNTGIGEIDSKYTREYFGGLNGVIDYIYSQVPTAKIYLANVLHKGKYFTDPATKELMDELNAKLSALSAYKSYQLIDLVSGTGINDKTYEALTYDGTHLNQEGNRLQGLCILKAILGGGSAGGSFVDVDDTLTKSGKAADAATVGTTKMDKKNPMGDGNIIIGQGNNVTGRQSAVFGDYSKSTKQYNMVTGWQNEANADYQVVHGSLNRIDSQGRHLFVIGNGYVDQTTHSAKRSNAFTVDKDGNIWCPGTIYVGGISQDNGTALIVVEAVTEDEVNALLAEWNFTD